MGRSRRYASGPTTSERATPRHASTGLRTAAVSRLRRAWCVGAAAATVALIVAAAPAHASPSQQPYGSCTMTTGAVTAPAAGVALWTVFTVPAGHYYDVGGMTFTLVAANAGGTRGVGVRITDASSHIIWRSFVPQVLNSTARYDVNDGVEYLPAQNVPIAFPQETYGPGIVFQIEDSGAQGADQFGSGGISYCDGTSASAPALGTVHVDNPQTSVTVSNPQTSVTVSNPQTSVTVSNPQTAVTVSNLPTVYPTTETCVGPSTTTTTVSGVLPCQRTASNPTTHVTVDNTVPISGSITAVQSPPCAAASTTTTDPTGNADDRLAPCVQPVQLDGSTNVTLWVLGALLLVAAGASFGVKIVKGS